MSQAFTIVAIIGFSLGAVLAIAAIVMFFKLNIKEVRNDLTGKTATRSIAEIRARAKTRKRTTTEAGKKLGWGSSEPIKMPSGPLKSYTTDVATEDILSEEPATTFISDADDSESETTLLTQDCEGNTTLLVEEGESETTLLSHDSYEEESEGKTTMLTEGARA